MTRMGSSQLSLVASEPSTMSSRYFGFSNICDMILDNVLLVQMGFMSSTVDGVFLGMKSFLASADRMNQLDPFVVPLPWRDDLFNSRKVN